MPCVSVGVLYVEDQRSVLAFTTMTSPTAGVKDAVVSAVVLDAAELTLKDAASVGMADYAAIGVKDSVKVVIVNVFVLTHACDAVSAKL